MLRKALKEKHLIDALWPSPAPRSEPRELLAQGVQVRRWYGDMFAKYFTVLCSLDEFEVKPEVDQRVRSSGTLMLIPFADHLVNGDVQPITPIVARGAGYASNRAVESKGQGRGDSYGEPGRFEIRFDAPAQIDETFEKSVVRQCQCLKCGTKRDVEVVIAVDPSPNGGSSASRSSITTNSAVQRRLKSGERQTRTREDAPPAQPPRPQPQPQVQPQPQLTPRPSTPERKKQCPRCTFLNHVSLTECEMCAADLPTTTVTKSPSPVAQRATSHSHSFSLPPPTTAAARVKNEEVRPGPPNRHSLSSTLFSIFPFSQAQQQEHHAKLPAMQQVDNVTPAARTTSTESPVQPASQRGTVQPQDNGREDERRDKRTRTHTPSPPPAPAQPDSGAHAQSATPSTPPPPPPPEDEPHLSQPPQMAMMPLTPPPPSTHPNRQVPVGLPTHLMDENYVPSSPGLPLGNGDEEEEAGWGDLRRKESNVSKDDDSDEEGNGEERTGLVDLDAVAREEIGVWGDRED